MNINTDALTKGVSYYNGERWHYRKAINTTTAIIIKIATILVYSAREVTLGF